MRPGSSRRGRTERCLRKPIGAISMLGSCNWPPHSDSAYRAQLRFSLRITVATLAFAFAQVLSPPLHGLWAVLTALAVTQMSVGRPLRATAEYVVGTLGGVICASGIAQHG